MRLIINSYLKTFLKNWVSTVGILAFIIILGAVVLGMMTTPLQLSLHVNNVKRQSTQYDYQIREGSPYTDDFSYHYFLLNGDKYTVESSTGNGTETTTVLTPISGFEIIAPDQLETMIESWKKGENLDQPTFLSKSSYLVIDEAMKGFVESSQVPVELKDQTWEWILNPENLDPNWSPIAKQYVEELNANLGIIINTFLYAGQESASQNLKMGISLQNLSEAEKQQRIELILNDLKTNLLIQNQQNSYFSNPQQLYIANNFLKLNSNDSNLQPITSLDELTSNKFKDPPTLWLTGIITMDAHFREMIIQHQNSVNAYLLDNIFHNFKNKKSINEKGELAYSLATSVEYSLVQAKAGLLTPEFSFDVRTSVMNQDFNQLILETGNLPNWDQVYETPEIVLSSAFMKANDLKLGDFITLPGSIFGRNINQENDRESWTVANEVKLKVVGTGSRYDELTPGSGYTSFVQKIDTYAYVYLPANFTSAFKKASFIYGDVNNKTYSSKINFRIKNQDTKASPRVAFDINPRDSESIYADATTLIKNFSDLLTILKLNNITIQVVIYNVLGLLCLILAFIFINFIIKKEINETRRQLGIFKSFGYKTSELSLIFSVKTLITILIGMIIGWLVSFPVQIYMGMNFASSVVFSYQSIYFNPVLIAGIFLLIPGLFMLISYLITLKYLSESALSLISNGDRIAKHTPKMSLIARSLMKKGKGFNYRLRRSFVQRSKGKFTIVQILFGVSALLYTLMFGAEALMYQAIEQGFAVIKDGTDHEYQWKNRNELIINQTTDGKYSLSNITNYDSSDKATKIDYIDYNGYANPNQAILNNPNLKDTFSDARYRFRVLTDALTNSIVDKSPDPSDTDNWVILPTRIAQQKFANDYQDDPLHPDLLNVNYYLYKLVIFRGLKQGNEVFEKRILPRMIVNNEPYGGTLPDLVDPDRFSEMWWNLGDLTKIGLGLPDWEIPFKESLVGMTTDFLQGEKELINNLFITDLSRLLSMIFAEQYVTNLLFQKLLAIQPPDENGKYPSEIVNQALKAVYTESLKNPNSVLYHYDPRKENYWNVLNNPLLSFNLGFSQTHEKADQPELGDLLENLPPSLLGLLTSAMLAKASPDLANEAILNFNKFFYDSSAEHLQLLIDVLPTTDYDVGAMALQLDDVKNNHFGDPKKQYNFEGVSTSEYQKLAQDTGQKNTFYGIVPYAIAQKLKLKKGDILTVRTNTQTKVDLKIIVSGINQSITMPISLAWNIMVDYSAFGEKMFSDELKDKIGFDLPNEVLQPYLFNSLVSQKPMLAGAFDLKNLAGSLKTFKFVANNLTYSVEKGSTVLGGMFNELLGQSQLSEVFNRPEVKIDPDMSLITNPMMISEDKTKLVAIPYNIARVGVYNFTQMMNELMIIFMVLQSVLLTIILVVIMNIVVDEFAVVILTLRSLGYLQREINWIVMGSYVIGTIISFVIAYALSLVLWKIFLIVASNLWNVYVFLPFDWKSLVIPILVLGSIMFVGWMASNFQVNRRPLTQITNLV